MKTQYFCRYHAERMKASESEAYHCWNEMMRRGVHAYTECRMEAAHIYLGSALDIAILRRMCEKNGIFESLHATKPADFLLLHSYAGLFTANYLELDMDPCATTLQNKSTNQPKTGAPAPSILYLCKSDLIKLGGCSNQLYIDAVTEGLALHSAGEVVQPLKPYLRWPVAPHIADRIIAMPGFLGGESPIAGIKWVGSREANSKKYGLPRASALIILNDSDTNYPVAIMEGGLISGMRTAAITAVATKYLAKRDFSRVSCVGCGPIAEMHLRTLLEQFPSIQIIHLFDINTGAAFNLQLAIQSEHPTVDVIVEQSARAAVESAEVLVTCTVTDKPYIEYSWLKPGVFISNVSIMDVHKEVYERADKVVVDDWDQSNREKKIINQLVIEGKFSKEQLHAELGQIVTQERPGRESPEEIILLNAMGMAVDDLVCARRLYKLACSKSVGIKLPLF